MSSFGNKPNQFSFSQEGSEEMSFFGTQNTLFEVEYPRLVNVRIFNQGPLAVRFILGGDNPEGQEFFHSSAIADENQIVELSAMIWRGFNASLHTWPIETNTYNLLPLPFIFNPTNLSNPVHLIRIDNIVTFSAEPF